MHRRILLNACLMLMLITLAVACNTPKGLPGVTPPSALAYFSQGFAALRSEDWQTAQQAFTAGLQIEPQASDALTGRGWASTLHCYGTLKMLPLGLGAAGLTWRWAMIR
jgi:hypothetical protein